MRNKIIIFVTFLMTFYLKADSMRSMKYRGGDISMLLKYEELGVNFHNKLIKGSVLDVMKAEGCNFFRVRLFVKPNKKRGVIQDLGYVIKMGQLLKKNNVKFLLDIHYSDTWADPGQQLIPEQWKKLSFYELTQQVENYTYQVLKSLGEKGCLPDMVQVGNEITHGILWPHGKIHHEQGGWQKFSELLKAGIRGVRKVSQHIKIMIHVAPPNSSKGTYKFFDKLNSNGVEYDVIGMSYYPWWHGDLNRLKEHIQASSVAQNKPFIIVECAYVYEYKNFNKSGFSKGSWDFTPNGQEEFIQELKNLVIQNPLGQGLVWWYPESVKVKGIHSWHEGKASLFNKNGKALPALSVLASE